MSRWLVGGTGVFRVLIFMATTLENNKRIAKNTVFLWIRMLMVLLVSFYTSRIKLSALGVEDFNIYNVVGGIVSLFAVNKWVEWRIF